MNITTRLIEVYVNEPDTTLKNQFYSTLRDFQYKSYKYANEIVRLAFFTDMLKSGITADKKKLSGKEFADKLYDTFGDGSSKMNFGYKFASEEFKSLPSTIRASLNKTIYSSYSKDTKEIMKGNKSIRNYRRNMPVPFMKTAVTAISQLDKDFTLNLFGIPLKTHLGRDRSNNKAILENIVSQHYQLCDSSFKFVDKKLFLLITFKSPTKDVTLDPNKTLGVDLGINVPIATACNDITSLIGNKEDFLNKRLALQKSKRNLQKNLIFTRGGKGRNKKLAKLDNYRNIENNFATTYNHLISKKVIDTAIENKCQFINLEDLSNYKENGNQWVLRNWSYHQLQSFITYKARKYNITIRKINPRYTSQCCSKCGYIDVNNRPTQEKFSCLVCGNELNADANAAINISKAHTEEFINKVEEHIKTNKINKINKKVATKEKI